MSALREAFDEMVAEVPAYGDLDRAIASAEQERRRRAGMIAGLIAAAVIAVIVGVLAITRGATDTAPPTTPTPTPSKKATETIPRGPSEALAARQVGRERLVVAGKGVPGKWELQDGRRDVWVAAYFDDVGYGSPALWWGKGTTTHEVPGQRGGVAISQDAHWIVWTRSTAGGYQPDPPMVMEVVDTETGTVRWSRNADHDAPEIGALTVTNEGVVVFGYCLEPVHDRTGTPQCDSARIDVWAPRSGDTTSLPAKVTAQHGPPGTVTVLEHSVEVTGAHNGLLVRDTPSSQPRYLHVSERGRVEVVGTLPRNTAAVTADERFALLHAECGGDLVCRWTVLSLDDGAQRPIPTLTGLVAIAYGYDWPVDPYVVEGGDLLVIRSLSDEDNGRYGAAARCSMAQARCVPIRR